MPTSNSSDRLTKIISNLYTAVFENRAGKSNNPLIDYVGAAESMTISDEVVVVLV